MTLTRRAANWVCHDAGPDRVFVAFDCIGLTEEPVTDADISKFAIKPDSDAASQAWSAGCDWYFVNTAAGIILARPGNDEGFLCKVSSWKFLEAFIEAPRLKR